VRVVVVPSGNVIEYLRTLRARLAGQGLKTNRGANGPVSTGRGHCVLMSW